MHTQVPAVKIDAKPGEIFKIKVPKPVYKKEILPVSKTDLNKIAKTLGTTTYGPRRGLAIWCRLFACEKGLTPNSTDPDIKLRFKNLKREVDEHFGWMPTSSMWLNEYAADAYQWINTSFAVHPLLHHRFQVAARPIAEGAITAALKNKTEKEDEDSSSSSSSEE